MKTKKVWFIFALSVLLLSVTVWLYIIDTGDTGLANAWDAAVAWLWAFSLVPAAVWVYGWFKRRTFQEGAFIGIVFGISAVVIFLIFSPVFMLFFYFGALKKPKN
jgi:Na+(H+)/acetate symporter ActP